MSFHRFVSLSDDKDDDEEQALLLSLLGASDTLDLWPSASSLAGEEDPYSEEDPDLPEEFLGEEFFDPLTLFDDPTTSLIPEEPPSLLDDPLVWAMFLEEGL